MKNEAPKKYSYLFRLVRAWIQYTLKKDFPFAVFSRTVAWYDDMLNTGVLSFSSWTWIWSCPEEDRGGLPLSVTRMLSV